MFLKQYICIGDFNENGELHDMMRQSHSQKLNDNFTGVESRKNNVLKF